MNLDVKKRKGICSSTIMKPGFWILATLYLLRHFKLLVDQRLYLYHDNLGYHFPSYLNIANSLAHGYGFPRLVLEWGGSEIAMTAVSMSYFAPHRFIGYLLYALTPIPPLMAYKLTLILGFILNAYGWYLLWRKTLPREELALIAVFFLFLSGMGITILHHEQMLATVSWLPWCLLCAVEVFKTGRGAALMGACAGGLMTLHYPQIHLVGLLALLISFMAGRLLFKQPLWGQLNGKILVEALICFGIAVTPTLYIMSRISDYGSPVRGTSDFSIQSFDEYLEINKQQLSSATMDQLKNIADPRVDREDDQMAFYVTQVGFVLAILGVVAVLRVYRSWMFLIPTLLITGWATLGINGHLAQILYVLHFPGISQFRQWYHFSSYFILSMITLAALGSGALAHWLRKMRKSYLWAGGALLGLFAIILSQNYYHTYITLYQLHDQPALSRFSNEEYLQHLNGNWMNDLLPIPFSTSLVARKEDLKFFKECPDALNARAWDLTQALHYPATDDLGAWCHQLGAAPKVGLPSVTMTPNGIIVQRSGTTIVSIDSNLFLEKPEQSPANGAISMFKDSGNYPFRGSQFFYFLAMEYLVVCFGIFRFFYKGRTQRV